MWKGPEGLRALPVELAEVLPGEQPCWRLRPMGPATRGQRRNAVRAPMSLPVELVVGRTELIGETVDVSEGGLRCLFQPVGGPSTRNAAAPAEPAARDDADGPAEPTEAGPDGAAEQTDDRAQPAVGAPVQVSLALGDGTITARAAVVRRHPRTDRRIEVSLRFVDLPERDEDRIRARVFTELRVLRSRGVL